MLDYPQSAHSLNQFRRYEIAVSPRRSERIGGHSPVSVSRYMPIERLSEAPMVFKMILEGARENERSIARGFLKHIVLGFAVGLAFGSVVLIGLFILFSNLDLNVPLIFLGAALLQFGPIGGLVGAGVHLSRIADHTAPEDNGDDEDDDGPGSFIRATVKQRSNHAKSSTWSPTAPSPA
jgi:hypothetical protein